MNKIFISAFLVSMCLPPFSLLRDFSFQNASEQFAIRFRQSYLIWECEEEFVELTTSRPVPCKLMAYEEVNSVMDSQLQSYEDREVPLPDLEETQIWDSPNVTVRLHFKGFLEFITLPFPSNWCQIL